MERVSQRPGREGFEGRSVQSQTMEGGLVGQRPPSSQPVTKWGGLLPPGAWVEGEEGAEGEGEGGGEAWGVGPWGGAWGVWSLLALRL